MMAAARKTAAKKAAAKPESPPEAESAEVEELAPTAVDQGVVRGGWDVGYRGERVDQTPDEAYSVTGVLAQSAADTEE
jgi:hypothetical protein